MANEYLKRTNTSVANKKVFTYSFWMKGNDITTSSQARPIYNYDGGSGLFQFFVERSTNTNPGYWVLYGSGSVNIRWEGTRIDPAAWYHIVLSINTTRTQSEDRAILYINGVRTNVLGSQTGAPGTPGYPALNADQYLGANYINGIAGNSRYQLSDFYYVDGQALTADVFGFYKEGKGYQSSGSTQATDFRPGQWVPKSPRTIKSEINRRGGFGVNGFYLPMNDSSNFGADFHCAPNSIIKLKGEDLPQPRNGAPTTTDAYVSQLRSDPYASNLVLAVPGVELENTNPELVTNGDFSNGTTGWTGLSGGSLSVEDGKLKITETTGALDAYAVNSTAITTVVGKRYTIKWTFHEGTNTTFTIRFGNSGNQSQEYQSNTGANGYGSYPDPGTYSFTFTATATTLNLSFIVNQASSYGYVSNVSVKEAVAVRDYSADIKGSGTNKTLTGVNLAGVYPVSSYYGNAMRFGNDGTNGAGNTDMINVPTSSDFVFNGDVTIECWMYVKSTPSTSGAFLGQWQSSGGTNRNIMMYLDTSNRVTSYFNSSNTNYDTGASPALGLNQWHHIATEKDGSNFRLYLNGVCVGVNNNTPTAGNTSAVPFTIGAETESGGTITGADYGIDGYIQDVRVYKGVAKYKGGFDVPKPYTPVGIESWRQVSDTCKNNFCTLNPLDAVTSNQSGTDYTQATHSNGNLTVILSDDFSSARGSIGISTGKYYWEIRVDDNTNSPGMGVIAPGNQLTSYSAGANGASYEPRADRFRKNGVNFYDGTNNKTYDGLIVGVALDKDAGSISFYADGVLQSNGTMTGLNDLSDVHIPECFTYNDGSNVDNTYTWNFGQNPTFSGQITAGTYTDANGKGLFKYQPPSGFLALCEDNLPTPAIADPGEHFKTVLWTGDGSARGITGVGFKPDFVWIKNRDSTYQHQVYDSVRGAGQKLLPSTTNAESTDTANVSSFDSNGFSFAGGNVGVNQDTKNHVAWCWKAGGAAVSNTDGTITSQVSANQTAGFSIVSYQASNGSSIGHGLGKQPAFMIIKNRDAVGDWFVYHKNGNSGSDLGSNQGLNLNNADETFTSGSNTFITAKNSSTFTVGSSAIVQNGSDDFIAYCWAEIEGFSKFGSYAGTGDADGPFVWCGFKPAWVMVKNVDDTGGRNWGIQDSSRQPINPCDKHLKADSNEVENSGLAGSTYQIDLLSNGFKVRNNTGIWNNSGETIIFMAFAESPFQTANAK